MTLIVCHNNLHKQYNILCCLCHLTNFRTFINFELLVCAIYTNSYFCFIEITIKSKISRFDKQQPNQNEIFLRLFIIHPNCGKRPERRHPHQANLMFL